MLSARIRPGLAGVVVGALLTGGVAYAAIPHSTTKQISACYQTSGPEKGTLRVIDTQAGGRCRSGEAPLSWSSTGMNWRGAWRTDTAYQTNDAVTHDGSTWRAKRGHSGITPSLAATRSWALLAAAGADGTDGEDGADGADGQDGVDGIDGEDATLEGYGYRSADVAGAATTSTTQYTAIARGFDGLPVVAFGEPSLGRVRVAHCDDLACTTATTTTVATDVSGTYVDLAIGADGRPVISHRTTSSGGLSVTRCADVACTEASTVVADDPAGLGGEGTSITIGADGLPVVAHHEKQNDALRVTHCTEADCSSATHSNALDGGIALGMEPDITIDASGLPVVAARSALSDVTITRCANATCSAASTDLFLSGLSAAGRPSIAIGPTGSLHLAFRSAFGDLQYVVCSDLGCGDFAASTIDGTGLGDEVGRDPDLALVGDRVVVSHKNQSTHSMRFTVCADTSCASRSTIGYDDTDDLLGGYSAMTIGADGLPVISSSNESTGALRVTHCSDLTCVPYRSSP